MNIHLEVPGHILLLSSKRTTLVNIIVNWCTKVHLRLGPKKPGQASGAPECTQLCVLLTCFPMTFSGTTGF